MLKTVKQTGFERMETAIAKIAPAFAMLEDFYYDFNRTGLNDEQQIQVEKLGLVMDVIVMIENELCHARDEMAKERNK